MGLDFVFDACANKQELKCRTVVDEWTRECHAIDEAGSIRLARVIEVLARLVSLPGNSAAKFTTFVGERSGAFARVASVFEFA